MKQFTPTSVGALAQQGKSRAYSAGQVLYYQGEIAQSVSIIKSGVVKIYNVDKNGNEKILHLLKGGMLFPFSSLLGHESHINDFYGTLTRCQLVVIPREEFERQLNNEPALALQLLHWLAEQTKEILGRLASLENSSTYSRLAVTLHYLSEVHALTRDQDWQLVDFPVSHQLLAHLVGATRPSVTIAMKSFQRQNIVRYTRPRRLEINAARLQAKVNQT